MNLLHLQVDDAGRLVRGKSETPTVRTDLYDSMVTDPWSQYPPPPVEIKQANIYDLYDVHEEIGTGAFGVVHRCVEKATGKVLAAKFVPTPGGEKEKETVRNEIRTLSSLRHPAIVSLQDAFEMEQELVMVYEMSYVHLDLKPENIMFSTETSDRLKLIDFGLTTKLDPNQAVKVTTGTPEFAAPEVVSGREVSFYTDMWSVGVLAYILVSGLSPFGGADDKETVENVRHCDWMMEGQPEFEQISADAREFIRRLLVADPRQRMTVHQALAHPWLAERKRREELDRTQIPAQRFHAARNRAQSKYNAWPEPLLPLGRLSQFSSLRIYQPERYSIRETRFDPNDALPRFVLRPSDCEAREGQSAAFFCKVLSPVPVRLSWWKDGKELGSGDGNKCRKHHNANDYALALADLAMEDRGEYTVRAVNEFGQRECPAFLNVLSGGKRSPTSSNKLLIPEPAADAELPSANKASKEGKSPTLLQVPSPIDSMLPRARVSAHHQMEVPRVTDQLGPPIFSFSLRPRLIQKNHDCKLLCTVSANPKARIEWLKDGQPVDLGRVQTMFKSGVASLEIFNTKLEDAGLYTCLATNDIGQDETSATLSVETRHSTSGYQQMESVGQRMRTARRSVAEQRRGVRKSPPTSDMGNVQLMSGLVGERREKLVNRAQAGRRTTATSLAGSSERGSPEQDNRNGNC